MKLHEFFPGDFQGNNKPGKPVLDTIADYLKSKSIKCEMSKSHSGLQGYVRFKLRNGNKLLKRYDTFQVEIDYDAGTTEWSIVQRDPSKLFKNKSYTSGTANEKMINDIKSQLDALIKSVDE